MKLSGCLDMHRLDEERADRLQAEHEAEQDAKARQKAEDREQQRLRMVSILNQQVSDADANVPGPADLMAEGDEVGYVSHVTALSSGLPVADASFWLRHCRWPACVPGEIEGKAAAMQQKS